MTTIDKVVAAFSAADVGWTEAGASPYLDIVDAPTNIIHTFNNGVREGSFTFVAFTEALWAAITSVKLYAVMRSQDIDTNFVTADPTHGANLVYGNSIIGSYETIVDSFNTELLGRFVSVADLNTFGVTFIKTGSLTISMDQAFLRIIYTGAEPTVTIKPLFMKQDKGPSPRSKLRFRTPMQKAFG